MTHPDLGRRRFIVAAVTMSAGAIVAGPSVLSLGRAWALGGEQAISRNALAAMARQMYPHEALNDAVYAEVMEQAMALVANDALFAELVDEATRALDAATGTSFVDAPPGAQLAALQTIDDRAFFTAIRGAVGNRLYNHPATWTLIRYEGSSWEKGGYLERGAGEIDWLPEDAS